MAIPPLPLGRCVQPGRGQGILPARPGGPVPGKAGCRGAPRTLDVAVAGTVAKALKLPLGKVILPPRAAITHPLRGIRFVLDCHSLQLWCPTRGSVTMRMGCLSPCRARLKVSPFFKSHFSCFSDRQTHQLLSEHG